jgi:hypothetical protein
MAENQHPDPRAADEDEQVTLHHGASHPRRVDVHIHGTSGGSLEPPLIGLENTAKRILWYALMGVLTIAVAFGASYYVAAKGDYRVCVARNAGSSATNLALDELANAAQAEGDTKQAEVLHRFRVRRDGMITPVCNKPPFTREYQPANGG